MEITTNKTKKFEALVNALSPELFRYAYGLCRNRQLAEDLVQESYLRAWRARDSLRDHRAARSWLYTILRREFIRHIGRNRPTAKDPAELHAVAETDYDTSIEAFVLRRAMADLAIEYREPLLLQVIGGFTCNEIADMLDLTPNATMTRLSRARRKLRKALTDDGNIHTTNGKS